MCLWGVSGKEVVGRKSQCGQVSRFRCAVFGEGRLTSAVFSVDHARISGDAHAFACQQPIAVISFKAKGSSESVFAKVHLGVRTGPHNGGRIILRTLYVGFERLMSIPQGNPNPVKSRHGAAADLIQ